jgi:hypothetical protein
MSESADALSSAPGPVDGADAPRHLTLKKVAMAAVTAFVTVNIWTGAPLIALWVGSQVVGRGTLSMAAVGLVVVVLAVLVFALAIALTRLNGIYDEMIGRPRLERRSPWLRSMRDEAEGHLNRRVGITALEVVVMVNVYVAFTALMIWFAFFSGNPFPH